MRRAWVAAVAAVAAVALWAACGPYAAHSDGAGGGADPCDLDADGYDSEACGGPDCCDADQFAKPGAPFGELPNACGSYDWNCDGTAEPEYPELYGCWIQLDPCEARDGWADTVPACGEAAQLHTYSSDGCVQSICYDAWSGLVAQRCR